MQINKRLQYGLLLSLYLSRAGRAKLEDIAINLKLSRSFLEQVAKKLRISGVLFSFKGPGGGYELKEDARMVDIFSALSPFHMLTKKESWAYAAGEPEMRALENYAKNLESTAYVVLRRKVKDVMNVLVANEVKHFGTLNINGLEQ